MQKPHVKKCELIDVIKVADNLRSVDLLELKEIHGDDADPRLLLSASYRSSKAAWTIMHKNKPIGIFGVSPFFGDWGIPWLLATDELPKIAREFIKHCPSYVETMQKYYPNLFNYVYENNQTAITWLSRLGFEFSKPVNIGVNQKRFLPFMKRK